MFKQLAFVFGLTLTSTAALAQTDCGQTYVLKDGDSMLSVANDFYQDQTRWSVIYYANSSVLSGNLVDVPVGVTINIPCLEGTVARKADPKPLLQDDAGIKLVTGGNYAPFTDEDWLGDGMVTEIVNAALEESPSPVPFSLTWENDWSKHLFPMLDSKEFDMGFPWFRPDCERDPSNERCKNFHFSEPVFEILVRLYGRSDSDLKFDTDADLLGKSLCRPKGYFTHDLDRADRLWLTNKLITFVQGETPQDCFQQLLDGKVDAVTVNEFLGFGQIKEMAAENKIKAFPRPMSGETLHAIISKRHWRGTTHLYRFNAGLQALKGSKRYDEIVARHLGLFWGTETN